MTPDQFEFLNGLAGLLSGFLFTMMLYRGVM